MVPEAEALPLMQQEQKPRRFGAWYVMPALCIAAVTFVAARAAGGGGGVGGGVEGARALLEAATASLEVLMRERPEVRPSAGRPPHNI